jgi:hypothetical protein
MSAKTTINLSALAEVDPDGKYRPNYDGLTRRMYCDRERPQLWMSLRYHFAYDVDDQGYVTLTSHRLVKHKARRGSLPSNVGYIANMKEIVASRRFHIRYRWLIQMACRIQRCTYFWAFEASEEDFKAMRGPPFEPRDATEKQRREEDPIAAAVDSVFAHEVSPPLAHAIFYCLLTSLCAV